MNKKSTILYTSPSGDMSGGGQWSLYHLIKNLDFNQYIPIVALPYKGSFYYKLFEHKIKVAIIPLPRILQMNILKIIQLINFVRKNRVNIIHTDTTRETFYYGIVGKLLGVPVIWHIRVSDRHMVMDKILVKLCDALIPVSHELKKYFKWTLPRKIHPIYNGFDFRISREKENSILRKKYDIQSKIIVANIGRIEPRKEQFELIKESNNIDRSACLVFVGETNSKYCNKIKSYINDNHLAREIIFTGHQPDIYSIYKEIDILIFTARYGEGLPRSIIEAMAFKKPIITMNCTGASEVVNNGKTGYIIKSNDMIEFIKKLNKLICSQHLREKMGEQGYLHARKKFNIEKSIQRVQRLYSQLLIN